MRRSRSGGRAMRSSWIVMLVVVIGATTSVQAAGQVIYVDTAAIGAALLSVLSSNGPHSIVLEPAHPLRPVPRFGTAGLGPRSAGIEQQAPLQSPQPLQADSSYGPVPASTQAIPTASSATSASPMAATSTSAPMAARWRPAGRTSADLSARTNSPAISTVTATLTRPISTFCSRIG